MMHGDMLILNTTKDYEEFYMNDIDFKNTLLKAIDLDPSLQAGKKQLITILSKSNIYIEYTSLFTYQEWDTFCAILHIQVPVSDYETVRLKESYLHYFAKKLFGRQGDYFLTDTEIGIIVQSSEVFDFSAISATDVIAKAISDAEQFMKDGNYSSALDRVHTAFHGYLRKKLDDVHEQYEESDTLNQLYNKLHTYIAANMHGDVAVLIKTTMRSASGIVSALNDLRNRHSISHPNPNLISDREAKICISIVKSLSDYIELVV